MAPGPEAAGQGESGVTRFVDISAGVAVDTFDGVAVGISAGVIVGIFTGPTVGRFDGVKGNEGARVACSRALAKARTLPKRF